MGLEYVKPENPDTWLSGACATLVFGAEFAAFAILGDPTHWIVAAPLLLWSAYLFRRAWTARHDRRVLRAQELAGGLDKTSLRTRRQIQHVRKQARYARRDIRLTRDAEALLNHLPPEPRND